MQSDEIEGRPARLKDGRVGRVTDVDRFDRMTDCGTAVIELTEVPYQGEVVVGIGEAERCVQRARVDPDIDDGAVEGSP